ncbi:hypothetical protein NPIL_314161 [Nephila pilipes]|uniref:Uncharacterized protein n=1 Tax=Nephila pilipes TaxID=299642 RepID=A0A8X6T469_NEPPI|nr:hypothetical protein NPIL_314161 [Nephila pilipes]
MSRICVYQPYMPEYMYGEGIEVIECTLSGLCFRYDVSVLQLWAVGNKADPRRRFHFQCAWNILFLDSELWNLASPIELQGLSALDINNFDIRKSQTDMNLASHELPHLGQEDLQSSTSCVAIICSEMGLWIEPRL